MIKATIRLANLQTLAAAVAQQAVVDLMDHNLSIRTDAAEWIQCPDFDTYLLMAGVDHTAAACRLSLRRRGILPENSAPVARKQSIAFRVPTSSRVPHAVASKNPVIAETQAPAAAPGERHTTPPDEIPRALPEPPPKMAHPQAPGVDKLHGVEVIRL